MDDNLGDMINTWWNDSTLVGCGAFVLDKKLIFLKSRLCEWAKFSFGPIKLKKLALLHELDKLDLSKETKRLNNEELIQEYDL